MLLIFPARRLKAAEIRKHYSLPGTLAFIHVRLLDNRSEFIAPLQIRVVEEHGDFVIDVSGAIAIANTIAYVSELIDPTAETGYGDQYFRIAPRFETGDARYAWLNTSVFLAEGRIATDGVEYEVFRVT